MSCLLPAQPPGLAVDITSWPQSEEFGVYPVGSKPKRLVLAPEGLHGLPFIIPGHRYLYKTALGWQRYQVWSEVIAYRIARVIGVPVPPCFIAFDRNTGTTGALVEFFLGYPSENQTARLVHAADIIASLHRSSTSGRPNNFQSNARICRIVLGHADGLAWWATAFAFDALIGNTDRHTENWGFLVRAGSDGTPVYSLAPLYDNGTSLAYERSDQAIERATDNDIQQYLDRGLHLSGWDMRSDRKTPHFSLCAKLLQEHPSTSAEVANVIRFDMAQISQILTECTTYEVGLAFSRPRATFVERLVAARQQRLRSLI